jgi:hypothetical protein
VLARQRVGQSGGAGRQRKQQRAADRQPASQPSTRNGSGGAGSGQMLRTRT